MSKIKNFFIENKKDLEGMAGMMILAAVAFSANIGSFPSLMLAMSGVLVLAAEMANEKPRFLKTLAVVIILFLPIVDIFLGENIKHVLLFVSGILAIASFLEKKNEKDERY